MKIEKKRLLGFFTAINVSNATKDPINSVVVKSEDKKLKCNGFNQGQNVHIKIIESISEDIKPMYIGDVAVFISFINALKSDEIDIQVYDKEIILTDGNLSLGYIQAVPEIIIDRELTKSVDYEATMEVEKVLIDNINSAVSIIKDDYMNVEISNNVAKILIGDKNIGSNYSYVEIPCTSTKDMKVLHDVKLIKDILYKTRMYRERKIHFNSSGVLKITGVYETGAFVYHSQGKVL